MLSQESSMGTQPSRTAFIVLPLETGHPLMAEELESTLALYMHRRDITGRTKSFYDEDAEDGTEHGVRIDVSGLDNSAWETMLDDIEYLGNELYGNIRIDQG
jgi:hypothetical protein